MVTAWDVFWVRNCRHTTPRKDKFVVIIATESRILEFFINSQRPSWVDPDSKEALCHAVISHSDHPFLKYVSFVGCDALYEYRRNELTEHTGSLSSTARRLVKEASQKCPRLGRDEKIMVNKAFSSG